MKFQPELEIVWPDDFSLPVEISGHAESLGARRGRGSRRRSKGEGNFPTCPWWGRISGKLEGSSSSSNQNGNGCYMEFARACLWMASRILHEAVESLEMRALDLRVRASGPKVCQVCSRYSKGIRGVFHGCSGVFRCFSGVFGLLAICDDLAGIVFLGYSNPPKCTLYNIK